ncbi:hypothetical protein [Vibrio sp. FF145]|uniref:hypothetical protein n=1 Tax=unclassified Vibrio TaxID=2614977 RepID=UPI00352D9CAB
MFKFVRLIVLSNLLALLVVVTFEYFTGYLKLAFSSDYAFYSMLILLALGSLLSFSGHKVGYSDPSNMAGVSASSLIENESAKSTIVTKLESTSVGHSLLIASLLPLLYCLLS